MTAKKRHPNRLEITEAMKSGNIPFRAHLEACEACRIQFELQSLLPRTIKSSIEHLSKGAIERFKSIPLLEAGSKSICSMYGRISFDSWAVAPAMELRALTPGAARRLCLKAGKITVEIVAERLQDSWEFTARVLESDDVVMHWVIMAGGNRLLPKSLGFYHWVTRQAPRTFRLISDSFRIDFEKVSWA